MPESSKIKNLIIRALSALVAVVILVAVVWQWQTAALQVICTLGVLLGTRELIRILFDSSTSFVIKILFFILTLATFVGTSTSLVFSALIFALSALIFLCVSLVNNSSASDLADLLRFQTKAILGFFYMGLLPGFAMQVTYLPDGLAWFLAMLGIVFAGDTCAYLAGLLFGKHLLMPMISPKKTVEGSLGGLAGSVLTGWAFTQFVPGLQPVAILILSLCVGLAGQMGDLFESLLKRVANQKDSGRLMPGHGGVLDRVDGVLFASPVLLAGAMIVEFGLGRI